MSLRLLDDLSLFPLVFHIPPTIASALSSRPSSTSLALAAASILQTFLRPETALFPHPPLHPLISSGLSSSISVAPRLYMACALTPGRGITYVDVKGKQHSAVEAVIREGLKVGTKNHYLDGIPSLFSAAELLRVPDLEEDKKLTTPSERVTIGLCVPILVFVGPYRLRWSKVCSFDTARCIMCTPIPTGRHRCSSHSFKSSWIVMMPPKTTSTVWVFVTLPPLMRVTKFGHSRQCW